MKSKLAESLRFVVSLLLAAVVSAGCVGSTCVVDGTLVRTPSGDVPIERLRPGDDVIARTLDGCDEIGRVTAIRTGTANQHLLIETKNGARTSVTGAHPLATSKGWSAAGRIPTGSDVLTTGGESKVRTVRTILGRVTVRDLSVSPQSTFYAGEILVHNKSIDVSDHPAAILPGSGLFAAADGRRQVSVRRISDGSRERIMETGAFVLVLDAAADGGCLAAGCSDGSVHLWDIRDARHSWTYRSPARSEICPNCGKAHTASIHDLQFSTDGLRIAAADSFRRVTVLDTQTGKEVRVFVLPASLLAVTLAPDGSWGVTQDSDGRWHKFDVSTGESVQLDIQGWRPARFAPDGSCIAMRSSRDSDNQSLRIFSADGTWKGTDHGRFREITRIRPHPPGGFLIIANDPSDEKTHFPRSISGWLVESKSGTMRELWRIPHEAYLFPPPKIDFDLETMRGVTTRHNGMVERYDLRSGILLK